MSPLYGGGGVSICHLIREEEGVWGKKGKHGLVQKKKRYKSPVYGGGEGGYMSPVGGGGVSIWHLIRKEEGVWGKKTWVSTEEEEV